MIKLTNEDGISFKCTENNMELRKMAKEFKDSERLVETEKIELIENEK